ncbi:MAG: cell division protein ZapA [Sphingomonadaceae bacterium]
MATIDIDIAGRRYAVACRDGEEEQLRAVAALVDTKAQEAARAVGSLSETRQLLYAALLLADNLMERSGLANSGDGIAEALEAVAERAEALAARLEESGHKA